MAAKILYVEDNPQSARLARKVLAAAGYQVLEAETGLGALAVAAQESPDLILMDVNLPDISGLEATTRLKSSAQLSWIPVIALTANAMHGDREHCLSAGCDGYLAKPVMKTELLHTVAMYLNQIANSKASVAPAAGTAEK